MKLNSIYRFALLNAALVALPNVLQAQDTHYPAGVEGIKAATLPPPGLYLRDYNYFYWSKDFKEGPPDFNLFAYIQAPRLVWISDFKILGGNYGADVLVPLVSQSATQGGSTGSSFGLGDIFIEPMTLSWHEKQYDLAVGYGCWVPSGDCSRPDPAYPPTLSPGKGFWTQMLTAGGTWYADEGKTWSFSLLNRYEFNQTSPYTDFRPGQYLTMEWGIGKTIAKLYDIGVVGYYQLQTTAPCGQGTTTSGVDTGAKQSVVAVGPEIGAVIPQIGLIATFRWEYELQAHNRPRGDTAVLTLTKRF